MENRRELVETRRTAAPTAALTMVPMQTHATTDSFFAELDALGLAAGSWAATDADGTLWAADVADVAWRRVLRERRLRPAGAAAISRAAVGAGVPTSGDGYADAEALYAAYLAGEAGDPPLIEAMTACYAGWTPGEARAFADELARELVGEVYATTPDLLRGLAARGLRLAVVSGSPAHLVAALLRALEVDPLPAVYGTGLHSEGDRLGDRLRSPITWEAGKLEALRGPLGGAPLAVAWGDSYGDLPLLEAARALSVLVHPRPSLLGRGREAHAAGRGRWSLLTPPHTLGGREVAPPASDRVIG